MSQTVSEYMARSRAVEALRKMGVQPTSRMVTAVARTTQEKVSLHS